MPAPDFSLRNIAQAPDDNRGGLRALWYTPAANVRHWPGPETPLLIERDLELVPGATWYQLVGRRYSLRYTQTPKTLARHGHYWQHKVKGILARHSEGLAAGLETLEGQKLLVLYRDQNGLVQLVGTPEQPLTFEDTYDSAADPAQFNGFDFVLQGDTLRRARPYLGTWTVSGRGLQYAVQLQDNGTGLVLLRTAGGRLLATVPAGRTVVLKSDFNLAYQIL
jgi:hypothetical protein